MLHDIRRPLVQLTPEETFMRERSYAIRCLRATRDPEARRQYLAVVRENNRRLMERSR